MTFAEADAQFDGLHQRYQVGALTAEQYDAELRRLMVMDGGGRWWAKARESGAWHYYDPTADRWIPGLPPTALGDGPPLTGLPSGAASPLAMGGTAAGTADLVDAAPGAYNPYGAAGGRGLTGMADMSDMSSGAGPALTPGVKVLFALFSFLVPVLGIVLFLVYRRKPHAGDRAAARLFLILGVVSLLLSCLCSSVFVAATQSAILNWGP